MMVFSFGYNITYQSYKGISNPKEGTLLLAGRAESASDMTVEEFQIKPSEDRDRSGGVASLGTYHECLPAEADRLAAPKNRIRLKNEMKCYNII